MNLIGANLSHAELFNAGLVGANLTGANLSHADLYNTDLSDANLTNANLTNINLDQAYLSNAKLSGAYIELGSKRVAASPAVIKLLRLDVSRKHTWGIINQHPEILDALDPVLDAGVNLKEALPWLFVDE